MVFAFSIKKDQTIHEWRIYEQSNSQILLVEIWKSYPDKNFQSFVNRYCHFNKQDLCL